jgi:hypothetical protein
VVIGSVLLAGLRNSDEDTTIRCMEAKQKKVHRRYDSKYIVHDGRKFVYFVIQKVACTSLKTALLPLFEDLDAKRSGNERFERTREDGSREVLVHKLFDRSRHQVDKPELLQGLGATFRDYLKVAFVRNPWDRLVSCYSEKIAAVPLNSEAKQPNLNPRGQEKFHLGMPFSEFVEAVHATPDDNSNPHYRSQHMVVCDPEGRVMANFVGRFENLREDFALVAEKIGAPGLELPHRLKSRSRKSRPYTDFYDERLKRLVGERYERDIETFGYSF